MTEPQLPAWIAQPAAALYGLLVGVRNRLYASGALRRERAPRPVVSVGNLVAGGSGKTPLVAWIAAHLISRGVPCGVLTRGYGRRDRRPRQVLPGAVRPAWWAIGDEPWLLAHRLPELALGVDGRRIRAARRLASWLPGGAYVLDDGFQHRCLRRDLDIVTVSAREPFGGGRLLPAGRLREPVSSLARADWVVITGADDPAAAEPVLALLAGLAPRAGVAVTRMVWRGTQRVDAAARDTAEPLPAGPVLLVAGIVQPGRFRATVEGASIDVAELLSFPDHHVFDARAVARIIARAERLGAVAIVTTEKDAPRLAAAWVADRPLWAGVADLEFLSGQEELAAAIDGVVRPTSELPRLPSDPRAAFPTSSSPRG